MGTILHQESSSFKSGVLVAKRTLIKTSNKPKIFPSAFNHHGTGSKTTLGRYHLLADTGSCMDFGYIIYYINTTKQGLHNTPPCESGPALNHSIFLNWMGVHSHSLQVSELSPWVKIICYRHDVDAIVTEHFNKGLSLDLKTEQRLLEPKVSWVSLASFILYA